MRSKFNRLSMVLHFGLLGGFVASLMAVQVFAQSSAPLKARQPTYPTKKQNEEVAGATNLQGKSNFVKKSRELFQKASSPWIDLKQSLAKKFDKQGKQTVSKPKSSVKKKSFDLFEKLGLKKPKQEHGKPSGKLSSRSLKPSSPLKLRQAKTARTPRSAQVVQKGSRHAPRHLMYPESNPRIDFLAQGLSVTGSRNQSNSGNVARLQIPSYNSQSLLSQRNTPGRGTSEFLYKNPKLYSDWPRRPVISGEQDFSNVITVAGAEIENGKTGRNQVQLTQQESDPLLTSPDTDYRVRIPVGNSDGSDKMKIVTHNGNISIIARDAPVSTILSLIAQQNGLNIISSQNVSTQISVTLTKVSLDDALNAILSISGQTWVRQKNIIYISSVESGSKISPHAQGRQVRVIPLNFVAATDVDLVVQGLLSPIGQSFVTEVSSKDKRKTQESIVIEDLPDYLSRIENYIAQVDRRPRQVLVKAHLLQVTLDDDTRHGVNFDFLAEIGSSQLRLKTVGLANPAASPAFFLGLDGTDLDSLVEAIKSTTDAKTLASPEVLVINGQEARIQIGQQFGFLVTTTTQTSTLQNVQFLDVGVVLRLTPQITDDGQVLMTVKPEVSSGRINAITGLPEEETTEVETTVMLRDGQGMVIGGLIKEADEDRQSKVPILGDLWLVGRLFQRRTLFRSRQEIIIVLVPYIVPYDEEYQQVEDTKVVRAMTPLLQGALQKVDRPWEATLPDAMYDPRSINLRMIPDFLENLKDTHPLPIEHYFPTGSEQTSWVDYGGLESYSIHENELFDTIPETQFDHSNSVAPRDVAPPVAIEK